MPSKLIKQSSYRKRALGPVMNSNSGIDAKNLSNRGLLANFLMTNKHQVKWK